RASTRTWARSGPADRARAVCGTGGVPPGGRSRKPPIGWPSASAPADSCPGRWRGGGTYSPAAAGLPKDRHCRSGLRARHATRRLTMECQHARPPSILAAERGAVRIGLLGTLAVHDDTGRPMRVGGYRVRMLLILLALDVGRVVPAYSLIERLWEDEPPA